MDFLDLNDLSSTVAKRYNYDFLNSLNLDKDVIRRLSLHLDRLSVGSDLVYLTPLGKDNDPDVILSKIDKLFEENSEKINDSLRDLELSNRGKFGPRSISQPWSSRLPGLLSYFESSNDNVNDLLPMPRDASLERNLRPMSLDASMKYLKNSTNSGLPYYTRKSKVKDTVIREFNYLIKREDPCILFTRTQEGNKTRNVWGYPIVDTLNEMRFYRPLLKLQSSLNWRSALRGPDYVDKEITNMMLKSRASNLSLISIDFSAFDASVGKHLQERCFEYIKLCFNREYSSEIDYIRDRFNNIELVTPTGIFKGSHGVPSGATFTNEVDSLAQYLIASNSGCIIKDMVQIQGDDGAYAIRSADQDKFKSSFVKAGLNVNEEKSYVSNEYLVYLQRLYDYKYINNNGLIGGIYPIYRAVNRLIYQERFSDFVEFELKGKDYYSIRTLSILENCKYHPLFKDFVKIIFDLDKYSLDFTDGSLAKYNSFVQQTSGTVGFLNNQIGDDIKGIRSFESYKIIKELA